MHKKDAPNVTQGLLSVMGKLLKPNRDSGVWIAGEALSGRKAITASTGISTGLSCGLWRAVLLEGFVSFPATVPLSLKVSRITGLSRPPERRQTTPLSAIWSMMLPTFIRTGVY